MRKAIVAMLLAVVSSSAAAGWVRLGSNTTNTLYADPATIRGTGGMVKMWSMEDFHTGQVKGPYRFLSLRIQREYDCKEAQFLNFSVSLHSENMVKGQAVYVNNNPSKWAPIPPRTGLELLWKFACGRR